MAPAIDHLTGQDCSRWQTRFDRVGAPGPYHDPTYLSLLAGNFEFDSETAEAVAFADGEKAVYYPFLRRPLESVPFEPGPAVDLAEFDDIVSSWYYGGPLTTPAVDHEFLTRFFESFSSFCRSENIVSEFVRFDPNLHNHERAEPLAPTFNRQTVPVDLDQSEEAIWNGYEDRNRRAINQALETDIVVEPTASPADVRSFHSIYANAMEARDAPEHYRFSERYFSTLLDNPDLATLMVSRLHGEVIGGFLIIHDGATAHHFLSASNPEYWDMRVNNLLYHRVVMRMHDTGRSLFDFQGGRPGVFRFKKGFSPDRGEFYLGRRIHLPGVYERLTEAAERHGIDTNSGYFPAYRIEQSN